VRDRLRDNWLPVQVSEGPAYEDALLSADVSVSALNKQIAELEAARSRTLLQVQSDYGTTPQVGAIVATTESAWGHVGYVEAIEGDEIIVSDMNVIGWNKVSKRRMKVSSGVIRGYIY